MQTFDFYQDEKMTIWFRTRFSVQAETKEQAEEIVRKACEDAPIKCNVVDELGRVYDEEYLYETAEPMTVEENDGYATIEVYERNHRRLIAKDGL